MSIHHIALLLATIASTLCASVHAQPVLMRTFISPNSAEHDFFGGGIALDGNYVLVGARGDDTLATDAGRAFLFDATTGNLLQTFSDPNPIAGDSFGGAVAMSGDYVVVGALNDGTNGIDSGRAFLFSASTGNLLHTFSDAGAAAGDRFGSSVAVNGGRVLIGAVTDSTNASRAGQAFLFDAVSGNLLHTLNDPVPSANDLFGGDVAIDGDRIVVGANSDDDTNAANKGQAFVFDAVTGGLLHTLNDPNPGIGERFGTPVAISGNNIVVGSVRDNFLGRHVGQAFLFDATSGQWLRTFNPPGPPYTQLFGSDLVISGDNVLIGASPDAFTTSVGDEAFFYSASSGDLQQTLSDPSTSPQFTAFSQSLAIDGDRVLVGAPGKSLFGATPVPGQVFLYNLVPEPSCFALASAALIMAFGQRREH